MTPSAGLSPGSRCIGSVRRDFVEWHLGRPRYALWALDLDMPVLRRRFDAAQAHLEGLLLAGYRRQPHVTLSLCGFPADAPARDADFGAETLAWQLAALRAARPLAFDIRVDGLASFASAPYLVVDDADGGIAALRRCLARDPLDRGTAHYVPHVTVGLYADDWPTARVQPRLDAFSAGAPLRLRVATISLLSYQAADIGGPLTCLAEYTLADGLLRWHGTALFAG